MMKKKACFSKLIVVVFTTLLFSCNDEFVSIPSLRTSNLSAINVMNAVSGGVITDNGNSKILTRGVCWSISSEPTLEDNFTTNGIGDGIFVSRLSDLEAATQYFVRAYATNSEGTAYGNELILNTNSSFVCGNTISDIDGNIYTTVKIGDQCWTKENLRTSQLNDGTLISSGLDNDSWLYATFGAFATYGNDDELNRIYGKLYNWYSIAANQLCPKGWHIPSSEEWSFLTTFLGGESEAGGKMKSDLYWQSPNSGITDNNDFSGLPGGFRFDIRMSPNVGYYGNWWSSSDNGDYTALSINLSYASNDANMSIYGKVNGLSCRCLKN